MGVFCLKHVRSALLNTLTLLVMLAPMTKAAEANQSRAYFEPRLFRSPILHVDDQQYQMGWFDDGYESAADAFNSNQTAQKHFDDYLTDVKRSKYILWGTLGATLTFLVMDFNRWHLPEREGSLIYNGITIGGIGTAIYFASSGGFHLGKAINIYNGHESAKKSRLSSTKWAVTPIILPTRSDGSRGTSGGLSFRMEW
jgi:hypothetical protein